MNRQSRRNRQRSRQQSRQPNNQQQQRQITRSVEEQLRLEEEQIDVSSSITAELQSRLAIIESINDYDEDAIELAEEKLKIEDDIVDNEIGRAHV